MMIFSGVLLHLWQRDLHVIVHPTNPVIPSTPLGGLETWRQLGQGQVADIYTGQPSPPTVCQRWLTGEQIA